MFKILFLLSVILLSIHGQFLDDVVVGLNTDADQGKIALDNLFNFGVFFKNQVSGFVGKRYFGDNSQTTGYLNLGRGTLPGSSSFALQVKFAQDPRETVNVILDIYNVEVAVNAFRLIQKNGQLCVQINDDALTCSDDADLKTGVWTTLYIALADGTLSVNGQPLNINFGTIRTADYQIVIGAPQSQMVDRLVGKHFAVDNIRIYTNTISSAQIVDEQNFGAIWQNKLWIMWSLNGRTAKDRFQAFMPRTSDAWKSGFSFAEMSAPAAFVTGAEAFADRVELQKRALQTTQTAQDVYVCEASGDPHLTGFRGNYYTYGDNRAVKTILAGYCPNRNLKVWNGIKGYGWYWSITSAMTLDYKGMVVNVYARNHNQLSRDAQKVYYNFREIGYGNWWNGISGENSIRISYSAACVVVTTSDFEMACNFYDIYMNWRITFKNACGQPNALPYGLCGGEGPGAGTQDCVYTAWGDCSATCNRGIRARYLIAGNDGCAAVACEYCNCAPCPCLYSPWSECDAKCNYGMQFRTLLPGSGSQCYADWNACQRTCANLDCECEYGEWPECSKWCGGGTQTRGLLRGSGPLCPRIESKACNTQVCTCEYIDPNPPCEPVCGPGAARRFTPRPGATCGPKVTPCSVPCDIDECAEQRDNCHPLATCTNVVCDSPSCFQRPTFTCTCPRGYRGNGVVCTEIDECKEKLDNCHRAAKCTNTPGSFTCACNDDWTGDGVTCRPLCDWTPWTKCAGFCDGVGKQYRGVRPTLANEPLCQILEKECDMPSCPEIPDRKCEFRDEEFEEAADKACRECIDPKKDKKKFDACMDDVCFGDDIEIVSAHCDFQINDCLINAFKNAWQDPLALLDIKCPEAPCTCTGHGTCDKSSGKCACDEGWTGKSCQFKVDYPCLTLKEDSRNYTIHTHREISDNGAVATITDLMEMYNTYAQQVKDSVVFYFASSLTDAKKGLNTVTFWITIDDTDRDTDGGSFEYKITHKGADLTMTKGAGGFGDSYRSGSFQYKANVDRSAGAVLSGDFTNMDLEVEVWNVKGINQVLVGSGTGSKYGTKFDIISIPKSADGKFKFTIESRICEDTCSQHGFDCFACTEDPKCGYCRDSQTCVAGDASGPLRQECLDYRYTFDSGFSRRLALELGFPVEYESIDVWLSDQPANPNTELKFSIAVSQDDVATIAWDVLFMMPRYDPQWNANILRVMEDIVTSIRDFNEPRLGLATWGKDGVTIIKPITSVWQRIGDWNAAANSLPCLPYDCAYRSVLDALAKIGCNSPDPAWKKNARRAVIIAVNFDFPDWEYDEPRYSTLLDCIVKGNYYPIIVTKSAMGGSYDKLIRKLRFGMVLPFYTRFSVALGYATDNLMMFVHTAGHLNLDKLPVQHVSGLNPGQRARFDYVLHKDQGPLALTKLQSPGFGSARIEAIESDIPTCVDSVLCVNEDRFDNTLGTRAIVMTFVGKTYHNAPIIFYIVDGPASGDLFQYDNGKVGRKIDWLAPTFLSDPLNRLIYIPPQYAHSWPFSPIVPYATISWASSDLCTKSKTCTTQVNILPVPTAPLAPTFNITMYEDTPFSFSMNDKPMDPDRKMDGTYETTQWGLVINPMDMIKQRENGPQGKMTTIPLNVFSNIDPVWVVPPQDFNGVVRGSFYAKDETNRIGSPGDFFIHVLPVNDPPTIFAATPVQVTMATWSPISITAKDIDSKEYFIKVILEEEMKGTMRAGKRKDANGKAIGDIIPKADITYLSNLNWGSNGPVFTTTVMYKPSGTDYSCDLMSGNKTQCNPETDIYTWFLVQAADVEGLKSAYLNISIIVLRAEVPPQVPEEDLFCKIKQHGEKVCTMFGMDVNPDPKPITAYITSWPKGVQVYQHPKSNGLVPLDGPNKGLITDPQGQVTIVGNYLVHGEDNTNPLFLYSYATYKVTNGKAFSDTKDVGVIIEPVNQPPVPITDKVFATKETPVLFVLEATDPDNSLEELTFTITKIPDAASAQLFLYDPSVKSQMGLPITTVPFKIEVQPCSIVPNNGLGACVWFLGGKGVFTTFEAGPKRRLSPPIDFSFSVADVPRYTNVLPDNNIVHNVPKLVDVTIYNVNAAPIPVITRNITQDTLSEIVLGSIDEEDDVTDCILTKLPSQGKVYQFKEGATKSNSTAGLVEIKDLPQGGLLIADPQCRILYQPPYLNNSDTNDATFRYTPIFGFFVREKNPRTPPALTSSVLLAPVHINQVIYAPLVFQDDWTQPDADLCTKSCRFKEDFNVFFPGPVGTEALYLGGWDVQHLPIQTIIESIKCGKQTEFYFQDKATELGSLPQQLPGTIQTAEGPAVAPVLFFRPFPDGSNYKCSITYKVTNGFKESVNSYVLTFTIDPVNDAPRLKVPDTNIVPENKRITIPLEFIDLDGDKFDVKVASCSNTKGTFRINNQVIDCGSLAGKGPSDFIPVSVPSTGKIDMTYTPPLDQSGNDLNAITFFMDDHGLNGTALATVPVDVVPINNAPTIYVGPATNNPVKGKVYQEISASDGTAQVGAPLSLYEKFIVEDVDAGADAELKLTITYTFGEIKFSKTQGFDIAESFDSLEFIGTQARINELMNTLTWSSTEAVQEAKITITVNDLGNSGRCFDSNGAIINRCDQIATVVAHVSAGNQNGVTNVGSIAGPVVAAAAVTATVGAIAAAGLLGGASSQAATGMGSVGLSAFDSGVSHTSNIFQAAGSGVHANPLAL